MYSLNYKKNNLNSISIDLPTSKSISNRALILNALLKNKIRLIDLSLADDTQLMSKALLSNGNTFQVYNAGTCMRFLTAYFSIFPKSNTTLICDERMKERPIKDLVNSLVSLGAEIEYIENVGFPPIKIIGKSLIGKLIHIDASKSSQFVTALMLIAPFVKNGLKIQLNGSIASFQYIKMTSLLMNQFGLTCVVSNNLIVINEFSNTSNINEYVIEKDWSAAAFWYLIVCINPTLNITLNKLPLNSIQGDNITAQYFAKLGVSSIQNKDGIEIFKENPTNENLNFDLINCIDLAPALSVACAVLNINTNITGLENLKIKESNRLIAIVDELNKLGYNIERFNDSIKIVKIFNPIDYSKSITINTYNDHRIAMAFAPLAMLFENLKMNDIAVVSKSYPTFFNDLKKTGVSATFIG